MFLNFSKRRKRLRQCYKTLSMLSPFDFTSVLFGQLWSYSVHFVHFDYLVYFGPIRSIFGLIHSTSVLFSHFGSIQSIWFILTTSILFRSRQSFLRELVQRTTFFTNWSIKALLVAFITGTYSVVPHLLGNTVAFILSCCFLRSMLLPLFIKKFH